MSIKKKDSGGVAIGGMLIAGVGVGLAFVQHSPMLFVAALLSGLGLGLVIAAIFAHRSN
ncbi:hypothetical protein [Spongiimicrobium sp. 2-473A-2-J]|uniref:hypothetical protein n=1 Tax=Eudoraea algarum TaxID=3417568 RepID=UPI003D35A084